MKYIAVIPARGGSKGVPNKNIREIKGKPLIAYTIEQALSCGLFQKVFVNTDCEKIKTEAEKYGAEVPFLRPDHLATDKATTIDTIRHAIPEYEKVSDFDAVFLLQPTSPFRSRKSFLEAIEGVKKCGSAVSYSPPKEHPSRMRYIQNGKVTPVMEEPDTLRRQELPELFVRNGAIYAFLKELPFQADSLIPDRHHPVIMEEMAGINIDTPFDMKMAELFLQQNFDVFPI